MWNFTLNCQKKKSERDFPKEVIRKGISLFRSLKQSTILQYRSSIGTFPENYATDIAWCILRESCIFLLRYSNSQCWIADSSKHEHIASICMLDHWTVKFYCSLPELDRHEHELLDCNQGSFTSLKSAVMCLIIWYFLALWYIEPDFPMPITYDSHDPLLHVWPEVQIAGPLVWINYVSSGPPMPGGLSQYWPPYVNELCRSWPSYADGVSQYWPS